MAEKYTAQQVIDALVESKGIIAGASRRLGTTRATVYRYIKNYATVKTAYEEARESNIDFVESRLMKAIQDGNVTAMIFFLKTVGRGRGYNEKIDVDHDGTIEFVVTYSDPEEK